MTEQFRITAGLDLGAIEATVYGDTWVELKVSDDDGDHVQYIEVHDARALRVWLDLVIPPDSVDETRAERPILATELRCIHAVLFTEPCAACESQSVHGATREISFMPDGVITRVTTREPLTQETKPKPTIEGLERLLQAEDPTPVHVWPDGSVHDAPPPPEKAKANGCICRPVGEGDGDTVVVNPRCQAHGICRYCGKDPCRCHGNK